MSTQLCQVCSLQNTTGVVQFQGTLKHTFKDMECCTTCGNAYENAVGILNAKFVPYMTNNLSNLVFYFPNETTSKEKQIQKTKERDGEFCIGACGEFYPMSEPNRTDGKFKCYGCRSSDWRD